MSLSRRRQAVDDAATNFVRQRHRLSARLGGLQKFSPQWHPAILVTAGLVGGYVLGRLQVARLAASAFSIAGLGMRVLQSPLGALALSSISGRRAKSAQAAAMAEDARMDTRHSG